MSINRKQQSALTSERGSSVKEDKSTLQTPSHTQAPLEGDIKNGGGHDEDCMAIHETVQEFLDSAHVDRDCYYRKYRAPQSNGEEQESHADIGDGYMQTTRY